MAERGGPAQAVSLRGPVSSGLFPAEKFIVDDLSGGHR